MGLVTQVRQEMPSSLHWGIPDGARVLIVSDDDSEARILRNLLFSAGLASECARGITAGCDAARSGQFQVVISIPQLQDGSWKRLTDIASHYDLRFEIILWARNYDFQEWEKALDDGAFDVLDAIHEESRVVETTKCAFWAAYLKGAGPNPRQIRTHRGA
jgi:DNA-binding NtrC family response regulator